MSSDKFTFEIVDAVTRAYALSLYKWRMNRTFWYYKLRGWHLTQRMTSAQVVEVSVNVNNTIHLNNYSNPAEYSRQTNWVYLHKTSSCALALTVLLNPLSAVHQYFPEWFLWVSNISTFPVPTVFPSLVHVIFGTGLPAAVQWNVVVVFSLRIWSSGVVDKLGGTKRRSWVTLIHRMQSKITGKQRVEGHCIFRSLIEMTICTQNVFRGCSREKSEKRKSEMLNETH